MHHPTDRITHTTAFVTPVVEHWLEREIAQWVHPMKDRSNDLSHHERTVIHKSVTVYLSMYRAVIKLSSGCIPFTYVKMLESKCLVNKQVFACYLLLYVHVTYQPFVYPSINVFLFLFCVFISCVLGKVVY